ncbi:MAG: cytochrome c biogenesis protein CcdA [Chloroflexi bacterium]|nr:cytochrome c biogenesis protein CcdA [Chloroflexota bacterium]
MTQFLKQIADFLPFGFSFGAGMLTTASPCCWLMLPAFSSFYLGIKDNPGATASPSRALTLKRGWEGISLTVTVTLGFLVLFSAVGLVVSLGGRPVLQLFPWTGLAVGIALVLLGLGMLLGRVHLGLMAASRVSPTFGRSLKSTFIFGLGYGVAALSCTLPIFLMVVGYALATAGIVNALFQFILYGLGMGTVVAVVILATVFFKGGMERFMVRATPYMHRIGALFLVGAGGYMIYYWYKYGLFLL